MIKLSKKTALTLIFALVFSCFSRADAAQTTSGVIDDSALGTVVEVFDADAIAVRLLNGQIAYVKLLGVDTDTYSGGLKYMQDNAFGRKVLIFSDYSGSAPQMTGRFNYMYVYLSPDGSASTSGKELLNQSLIRYGFAGVDEDYRSISLYNTFSSEQKRAKTAKLGMWGDGISGSSVFSDKININTASSRTLETYMTGTIPSSVFDNILSYRSYAPFYYVEELKFVKGMTQGIYDSNRGLFTVITNINTASERELKSLSEATTENVDNLLKYRNSQKFKSLTDLYNKADVERLFYDKNRDYICVDDDEKVLTAKPERIVNINTASEWQLSDISDVGSSLASRIVNNRRNGYTMKTLMELREIANISVEAVHRLSDNCHIYTDMNTANYYELESLFGSSSITREINNIVGLRNISRVEKLRDVLSDDRYDRIVDHVYVGDPNPPDRVNINTATESQLREVGFSYSDAQRILSSQGNMTSARDIPVDVSAYDKYVALFTNINTSSVKELRSLNVFSEDAISQITSYRDDQPFGSDDELEEFFEDNRLLSTYNRVKDFIVIR